MIGRTERSMGETPFFSNKTSSSNIECVYVIVIVELSLSSGERKVYGGMGLRGSIGIGTQRFRYITIPCMEFKVPA